MAQQESTGGWPRFRPELAGNARRILWIGAKMGYLRLMEEAEACPGKRKNMTHSFLLQEALNIAYWSRECTVVIKNNSFSLQQNIYPNEAELRDYTAMKWVANARHCGIKRVRACSSVKSGGGGSARTNLANKQNYNKIISVKANNRIIKVKRKLNKLEIQYQLQQQLQTETRFCKLAAIQPPQKYQAMTQGQEKLLQEGLGIRSPP